MDEMQAIRELLPESPPPEARVVVQARRLATGAGPRRTPWLRWGLPGAGLAAGAAAVAVTVAAMPPGTSVDGPKVQTAGTVLLAAALKADHEPVTSGTYWHTAGRERTIALAKAGFMVVMESDYQDWQRADGTTWTRSRDLGARPLRPADVAAWRKAGSPVKITLSDGKTTTTKPGKQFEERAQAGEFSADGTDLPSPTKLGDMPTDPGRLRSWLLALPESPTNLTLPPNKAAELRHAQEWAKAHHRPVPNWTPPPPSADQINEWLYKKGAKLVLTAPISPKGRAAAYRMLARLPGVTMLGTVRDADGRTGTAVGLRAKDQHGEPEQEQQRLVIAPADGRALAYESVVARAGDENPGVPAGTITSSSTIQTATWTNDR